MFCTVSDTSFYATVSQVECFDYNRSGNHSLIGEFYVTVRQLQMGPGEQNVYEAINPKKKLVRYYGGL